MERRTSLQIRIMLSYYFLVVEIYELTYIIFMFIKHKYTFFKASKRLSISKELKGLDERKKKIWSENK